MEYRLNKIDPDLRQRINDETKEGKVHTAQNVLINKDKKESKKELKHYKVKTNKEAIKLVVDAVKTESIEIEVFKDDEETKKLTKGSLLDMRR